MASGSNPGDAMVICPCTMGTLAAIANGLADNLIERAGDVMLKERRPLVLVPRETPLSAIHLENMLKLARAGAVILPPAPGFYAHPKSIADLVDFVVARILDHVGVPNTLMPRWGEQRGAAPPHAARLMFPLLGGSAREPSALPLFPLRTVLFPGGLLPLKVFEQRYIAMTTACMRDGSPFGVCLINEGDEVARTGAPAARFAAIGTLATHRRFRHAATRHPARDGPGRDPLSRPAPCDRGVRTGDRATSRRSLAEPARPLPERHAPLARLLELIAGASVREQFSRRDALRRRVVGRLPAGRAAAAAAHDQAEHARDQRRRRQARGARAVPRAAGTAAGRR